MKGIATVTFLMLPALASAQELEPGAYWPLPRGLNIVTGVAGGNWGDVTFDPALPVVGGHIEGLYLGEHTEVHRFGLGDPRFRIAVNLLGAPAMTPREFASYRQRFIVGVSLVPVPPLGQCDATKIINLGTNRWSFKSEVGLSRTSRAWAVEVMVGTWVFTDNTNFVGGRTREQDPIVATQLLTRRPSRTMWLATDANFYAGGRTTVAGKQNIDLQKNSRIGATFSQGFGGGHAIRASVSRGAYTTIGADFTSIAIGYNCAWFR